LQLDIIEKELFSKIKLKYDFIFYYFFFLRILLSHKETNVNHRNDQGGTALHFASAGKLYKNTEKKKNINSCLGIVDTPECIDLLLQHGAKVNAQDLKNNTCAMVACFFNKPRILTTLIRAGADLVPRNNEG